MAKITRNQAEQIVTAYNKIRDISAKYPDVIVRKEIEGACYEIYYSVEYYNGNIQIYVNLDGVRATMKEVNYCRVNDNELSLGGPKGLLALEISDE